MSRGCRILNVLILYIDTACGIIDGDPRLSVFKTFPLFEALKQSPRDLSDEHNANGVCRLVELGKPNLLLVLTLLTHLKVFSTDQQQIMSFGSSSTQSGRRRMHLMSYQHFSSVVSLLVYYLPC